jgi:quercetin dioxygenase-like cupin family protein
VVTSQEQPKMNSSLRFRFRIVILFVICTYIRVSLGDYDNLRDTCPTSTPGKQTVFINGFTCKNPADVGATDFKNSNLNHVGDTDNFYRSSVSIVTAADFPGLNTLGLSIARTDIDVDGLVTPHSHPRASEMLYVSKGAVIAGFIDTRNKPFQQFLNEGDVFVFPRGLLHFCYNVGYDLATVFSVLNSQNPGVVTVADALFEPDSDLIQKLVRRLISPSGSKVNRMENVTLAGFKGL